MNVLEDDKIKMLDGFNEIFQCVLSFAKEEEVPGLRGEFQLDFLSKEYRDTWKESEQIVQIEAVKRACNLMDIDVNIKFAGHAMYISFADEKESGENGN